MGSKQRRKMRERRGLDELTPKARRMKPNPHRGTVHHTEQGTWPIGQTPPEPGSDRSDPLTAEHAAAHMRGDHHST